MSKRVMTVCAVMLALAGTAQAGGYVYSPSSYYVSPPGVVVPQYYSAPIPVGVVQPVVVTRAYVEPVVYAAPVAYMAPVPVVYHSTYYSYSAPVPIVVGPVGFGPRSYHFRSRSVGRHTRTVERIRW